MENDEQLKVEAKIEYDQMTKHQKNIDEFNNLGSKSFGIKDILQIITPFGLLFIAQRFLNVDPDTLKIMFITLFATSFVQTMITAESKKVNRRIDLLLEILKQERGNKNT
ncbi:MAG: hypothetical protein HRT54_22895 [Colwellia sp.]|nr:hypothetical protein [Colwellia sp.]